MTIALSLTRRLPPLHFVTLLLIASLTLSACREDAGSASSSPTPTAAGDTVRVIRVVDGDTVEIEGGQRVRYIGIDTPESTTQQECFGKEASAKNRELVEGKLVRLEKDVSETDRFGRLLRYVYVGDVMVNAELVRQGYAQAATFPPDVKHQELFLQLQREAREAGRGLWSACDNGAPSPTTTAASGACDYSGTNEPVIKGNISSSGERIYHVPGGQVYERTVIGDRPGERMFCTEAEAQAAGWRRSQR